MKSRVLKVILVDGVAKETILLLSGLLIVAVVLVYVVASLVFVDVRNGFFVARG